LIDAEEREDDERDAVSDRAERGAVAAVADDRGGMGEDDILGDPLLDVDVRGERRACGGPDRSRP